MSPLPPIVEVLEQSVEELSLDDNSNAMIVLLDSDSEMQIVIISSPEEGSCGVNQPILTHKRQLSIERSLISQPSLTSIDPTHYSCI